MGDGESLVVEDEVIVQEYIEIYRARSFVNDLFPIQRDFNRLQLVQEFKRL